MIVVVPLVVNRDRIAGGWFLNTFLLMQQVKNAKLFNWEKGSMDSYGNSASFLKSLEVFLRLA